MTVIKHFKVAFSKNCIGYNLMHVNYIFATAAKSLICSAEVGKGGEGARHIFFNIIDGKSTCSYCLKDKFSYRVERHNCVQSYINKTRLL